MGESIVYNDFLLIAVNLLSENNDIRTEAEAQYDKVPLLTKVKFLLEIISDNSVATEFVLLCSVVLRRLFSSSFDEIAQSTPPEFLDQIKNQLIHLIRTSPDHKSRKKVCECAAELSKKFIDDTGNNHWPELLNLMFECVNSQDLSMKECALNLLSSVPGIFGNQLDRYLEVIGQMLLHCLSESPGNNLEIRTTAVKAVSAFILCYEEDKTVFVELSNCILPIIQLIAQTIFLEDEYCDIILKAMSDIAEKCPQSLRCQIDALIQLCLKALEGSDISEQRKHLCIEMVISLAENAPATIRKRGGPYLGQLVTHLLMMMTKIEEDPEWATADVSEEDDFESNNVIGETSLDRLACSVGGKTILPLVLNNISQMLQNNDWKHRFAAMMAVSAVGEGCHDQMLPLLPKIVDGLLPFTTDAHPRVRFAVCNALGQMATDFAPDFQEKFHQTVIPKLLILLDDNENPRVQAHAGAALVNFFEDCPAKIVNIYMDMVADKLEKLLNLKIKELLEKGTKLVLEQTVVTLASLADSSHEYFVRFYDKFVPCLKYLIEIANTNELKLLRGKAIECISLIGLAVGKERFCNDASDVMNMLLRTQTGEDQLADDDPQLSYMISAWARICKILGTQFEPYLPFVMPPVLKAASFKIHVALLDQEDVTAVESDNDWQCIDLGDQQTFGIKTTGLEEKATACQMLVCYARELKQSFANYVQDTLRIMVPHLKFYFHDTVRTAAAESLPHLIAAAKGRGPEYVMDMWNYIFPELMTAIENESERDVLSDLMSSLESCIPLLGREFLSDKHLESIVKALDDHLKEHFKRAQERIEKRKDEDYDEGLEEVLVDEDDEDVYILSKVADVLHSCFSVCKDYFLRFFEAIAQRFVELAGNDRSWTERHWAICVMDDVIEHGGPACEKYKDFFLPLLLSGLQSLQPEIRQASAYGWGVLAQFGGQNFSAACFSSIQYLIQIIQSPDARESSNLYATENAISAVTKILRYNNNNNEAMINQLLPIWLSWLPIWEDEAEIPHVYSFLFTLIEQSHPLIMGENNSNLPRLVYIITETVSRNSLDVNTEIGQKMVAFILSIRENPSLMNQCVESLNTQQRETLIQMIDHAEGRLLIDGR